MIEGIVPNFSNPITCTLSDRRGRFCVQSHVKFGRFGSLAFNSFKWRDIRLFNALPKSLRCIPTCSVVSFKTELDSYLKNIVHHPCIQGFNNSLDAGDCFTMVVSA